MVGSASSVLKTLTESEDILPGGVDMLFLDHVEKLYLQDFQVVKELGLLGKGAVVGADNVLRPGAPAYREFVMSYGRLKSMGLRELIEPGNIEASTSLHLYRFERGLTCALG